MVRSRGCADPSRCCNGGCARSRRVHRPLAVHWGAALPYGQLCRRTGSSTSHVLQFTVTWLVDDAAAQSCWRCIRGWLGETSELTQRSSFRRRKPAASITWASVSAPLNMRAARCDVRRLYVVRKRADARPAGKDGSVEAKTVVLQRNCRLVQKCHLASHTQSLFHRPVHSSFEHKRCGHAALPQAAHEGETDSAAWLNLE
jgi:hypothetical protein